MQLNSLIPNSHTGTETLGRSPFFLFILTDLVSYYINSSWLEKSQQTGSIGLWTARSRFSLTKATAGRKWQISPKPSA